MIDDGRFDELERRYYQALYHFRKQPARPALPGQIEICAPDRQGALQGMLAELEQRKASRKQADGEQSDVFVDPHPDVDDKSLPESLRNFSLPPPPLSAILGGVGRPPCDAQCLLRSARSSARS